MFSVTPLQSDGWLQWGLVKCQQLCPTSVLLIRDELARGRLDESLSPAE